MAWFKNWFNTSYYHILYKDRDFEEAEDFISLLVKDLGLSKNSKIIDLACGKGRHSVYLQKLGYQVLGLDLSEESILHNLTLIEGLEIEPRIDFKVHDMRNPILGTVSTEKVDAVFNLFTSFGYFESIEEDKEVFQSVHDILHAGGYFVLDFLNKTFVKRNLKKEYTLIKSGIQFNISKRVENNHIIKDIRFTDQGEDFHYFEKVKLHSEAEILSLAEQFNFEKVQLYGNYELGPFNQDNSPRCITIFRKR